MKVSIITVSYNSIKTINETISSVLNQTYPNIEYIIIDGVSNDGTLDIVNSFNNRITKIISEPDKGIYDAMNKGIKIATGDIIGILNSDDLYVHNKIIEEIASEFLNDNCLDILYGDLVYVDKYDTSVVKRKWVSCPYYINFFENGNVPPHPSLFVKKEIYNEIGLFNTSLKFAADYEFMLRLFKKNIYVSKYYNKILVKMRLGGATNKNFKNIIIGNFEILKSWRINNYKIPLFLIPKRFIRKLNQFV